MSIAETAKVFDGVEFGNDVVVEDFCLVGVRYKGCPDDVKTIIGDGAIIRSGTVIYAGSKIGKNFQTGHQALVRQDCEIGDDVSIGSHSVVEFSVEIRNGVRIHSQAFVPEFTLLKERAWIGPNVVLTNAKYPKSKNVKDNICGPTIDADAIIGANTTILPGLSIGKASLIGAGSVVTHSVPEGAVVMGNPAKVTKYRKDLPYEK